MASAPSLPRWDMSVVFPGLESPEFKQGFTNLQNSIQDLTAFFDAHSIQQQTSLSIDAQLIATFEDLIQRYNAIFDQDETLSTYIVCFVTTDSQNTMAQARLSEMQPLWVALSNLRTRFNAWVGSLDVEQLIAQSPSAQQHAYALRQASLQATHLMSPAEESLAAELSITGPNAWYKLHADLTSQMTVPFEQDGQEQELPMSVIRNLASEKDRDLRRQAYEAELKGWQQAALPLAAALNSIKGETNVLSKRRRWKSPLEASLVENSIDQQTLDAMLEAARDAFPVFHRYLHAKAKALGLEKLAWYDLFAPLGSESRAWNFDEANQFIVEQFGTYSDRLSQFADRAFREHWIDAGPRPGKRDGAFCISLRKDESRVFANYNPSYDSVSTLAHELGHAYHNLNLYGRTALQRQLPMTLAETASIFCETIIRHAALRNAGREEQIAILESSIQGTCQIVVDISSRFLFEQRVFEKREQRELSIEEFKELMLQAQRETYGDGLDENALHPYMWAVKQHYYGSTYYNYPYMFGLLFGLGLYARYQKDPEEFKKGYDELLSSTGLADAATLAKGFGIDLHSKDFWAASLDVIRQDVDLFEKIIQDA